MTVLNYSGLWWAVATQWNLPAASSHIVLFGMDGVLYTRLFRSRGVMPLAMIDRTNALRIVLCREAMLIFAKMVATPHNLSSGTSSSILLGRCAAQKPPLAGIATCRSGLRKEKSTATGRRVSHFQLDPTVVPSHFQLM